MVFKCNLGQYDGTLLVFPKGWSLLCERDKGKLWFGGAVGTHNCKHYFPLVEAKSCWNTCIIIRSSCNNNNEKKHFFKLLIVQFLVYEKRRLFHNKIENVISKSKPWGSLCPTLLITHDTCLHIKIFICWYLQRHQNKLLGCIRICIRGEKTQMASGKMFVCYLGQCFSYLSWGNYRCMWYAG